MGMGRAPWRAGGAAGAGQIVKRAGGFLYQNELAGFVKSRYCKEVRPGDAMCVNCQIRRIEDQKDRK
jgi:hypothetical protein